MPNCRFYYMLAVSLILASIMACGSDDTTTGQGDLNQSCYPNNTCNEPYICAHNTCVSPSESEFHQSGSEGQPCYPNQTCNEPYLCEDGTCVVSSDSPPTQPKSQESDSEQEQSDSEQEQSNSEQEPSNSEDQGALHQPCYTDGSCDGELICSEGVCAEQYEPPAVGGLGQPCIAGDTCNDPYVCEGGVCEEMICEPDETFACQCSEDQDGEAQCASDGMSHSPCDCPPVVNCNDHLGLEIIVDNDNPSSGYSESQSENWLSRPIGACTSTYRYLSHTVGDGSRKGKAIWQPNITVSGNYRVVTGFRATENRTPSADYFMYRDLEDSPFHKVVNQRQGNDCTYADMGVHYCEAGGNCRLVLDGTTDGHSDAADVTTFTLESCP